jgi:hypothetical protein
MNDESYLYPMEVVCAWCKCHMYWRSCESPGKTSHGICQSCKKEVLSDNAIFWDIMEVA